MGARLPLTSFDLFFPYMGIAFMFNVLTQYRKHQRWVDTQGIMETSFTQRFVFGSFPPKGMKKSSMVSWSSLDEMYMSNTPGIMENRLQWLFLADFILSYFGEYASFWWNVSAISIYILG